MLVSNVPLNQTSIDLVLDRTKRVKDARAEAQKEIDEYKKRKEDEFRKFEAEVGPAGNGCQRPHF